MFHHQFLVHSYTLWKQGEKEGKNSHMQIKKKRRKELERLLFILLYLMHIFLESFISCLFWSKRAH